MGYFNIGADIEELLKLEPVAINIDDIDDIEFKKDVELCRLWNEVHQLRSELAATRKNYEALKKAHNTVRESYDSYIAHYVNDDSAASKYNSKLISAFSCGEWKMLAGKSVRKVHIKYKSYVCDILMVNERGVVNLIAAAIVKNVGKIVIKFTPVLSNIAVSIFGDGRKDLSGVIVSNRTRWRGITIPHIINCNNNPAFSIAMGIGDNICSIIYENIVMVEFVYGGTIRFRYDDKIFSYDGDLSYYGKINSQ